MNKKKFTVLALLLIVVIALTSCFLVACNPDNNGDDDKTDTIEPTKGLLINNGDFKVVDTSVKTYPRSVTSWTGAKMYSTSSFRDDVTAGVISLKKDLYDENRSKWKDDNGDIYNLLTANGRYDNDDIKNALMVYMPEEGTDKDGNKINGPTAYGYTSASFSLDKGAYYTLSVDVLTYNIGGVNEADRGARIYLSSNTYAEFGAIDTKGEWKTYTIFIETSPASSTSLTLLLGLGKYSSYYTKGLTSGYAFFDNVKLELIEDLSETPENDGLNAFNNAQQQELTGNKLISTTTLKVPNGRFDFGSTTLSSSGAPSSWSLVTGNSGKDDPAPTSLGYNAVIDLANFDTKYSELSSTYTLRDSETDPNRPYKPADELGDIVNLVKSYTGRVGSNAFVLSQQLMTAQGIKSSRTITIEKNKTYAISVDLFTYGVHGAGVSLILTGSDGKDIVIKGISANPYDGYLIGSSSITPDTGYTSGSATGKSTEGWRTYTFYIKGNQFRDYSYNMAIWLGTDGTSDNVATTYQSFTSNSKSTTYRADGTFANGWVFIDDLKLAEIAALPQEDDAIKANSDDKKQTLDCSVENGGDSFRGFIVELTTSNLFGDGNDYVLEHATNAPSLEGAGVSTSGTLGAPYGWTSNFKASDASNPIIADTITEGIVDLTSAQTFNIDGITYPGLPYDLLNKKAYMIHANKESYYEVETAKFTIKKNTFYRMSVWVKTVDVASSSGAYVYLLDKSDAENKDATLTSFTKINTKDLDKYLNDWCELTIVVRGANDKDTDVSVKFTLGTGNRWASSTLTSGAMFVANMNMSTITYANFKDTTSGTYVKSVDMSDSYTYTFTNGNFDNYDLDDDKLTPDTAFNEQNVPGTPDDWTINDKTVTINEFNDETGKESSLFAGIIALDPIANGEIKNLDYKLSQQAFNVTGIDSAYTDSFYGNKGDNLNKYDEDYLDAVQGGPNILAMGSNPNYYPESGDTPKYAIGFASSSVTLSANTYYELSVYAKTMTATTASIFLSGESSASTGANYFLIESTQTESEWTKYTFFIEVGNTSVSVKLNLWLGLDVNQADVSEYLDSKVESSLSQEDKDKQKAELAKTSGTVFFDNIVYKTIDEKTYNEATDGQVDGKNKENKKISFLTDSFDSLSSSIESRSKLSSPNGWTGAVESGLSSSDSKVGVVYADDSFYETELVDGKLYARVLGKDYKEEDITVSDEDLNAARGDSKYVGKTDEQIVAALKEEKLLNQKKENWIPVSELTAHSGNRMLVINNTANSAYRYTSSTNTLKANTLYEISVFVKTYGLKGKDNDATIGATVELNLGSANETDKPLIFKSINTQGVWTEYKFFVQTRDVDVTSVTVKLSLGTNTTEDIDGESVTTGLTSGYAMFDDVKIVKAEGNFNELEETYKDNDKVLTRRVTADTEGKAPGGDENPTETPDSKFNLEYLWWMIPTIVIGLVIIAVVIVLLIKKFRKKGEKIIVKQESSPADSEVLDKKRNRYDEGKE